MEKEEKVGFTAFFKLFYFYFLDIANYIDFLFNLHQSSKAIEIPDGLPEIKCCQNLAEEERISIIVAKFFDFFWRLPVITLLVWFFKIRYFFTPWKSLLLFGIWSPRIIVMFFAWFFISLKNLFISPFGLRTPSFHPISSGILVQKARISSPCIDLLKEVIKLIFRILWWLFVSFILAGICFVLLLAEGFFWYNFTSKHTPLQQIISPEYVEIVAVPIIGMLPFPIYLHRWWGWIFIIPFVTLFLVVISLKDKFKKASLETIPIFEFFDIIFHPEKYEVGQRYTAYLGLLTIVVEAIFATVVCYMYLSMTSYIANSIPPVRGVFSFILGIFIPIVFTLIEVYIVYGIYLIWKKFIFLHR